MITTIKSNPHISHTDWSFLSNMLSGVGGIFLGWAIALMLGWV